MIGVQAQPAGNAETIEAVLAGMVGPLRAFVARRVSAPQVDDVLQEALLKVHQHGAQLRDGARVSAWVYRIARNAVADHHRSAGRSLESPAADLDPSDADMGVADAGDGDGDEVLFRQALGAGLSLGVDALPAPYAEALRLVELQGLSQVEAARRLGLAPSSLRTRVQRGRAMLRKQLLQACELHFDARERLVGCTPRGPCCEPQGEPVGVEVGGAGACVPPQSG